jgi:hypothetical protein
LSNSTRPCGRVWTLRACLRAARRAASLVVAAVGSLAIAGGAPATAGPAPGATHSRVPLAEVRPGQIGYGLTVFRGSRPDTFAVTVLGVQQGARAGGDIILVELAGHDLERTAVARGMSGSPVYLDDGRLLGAVAFGWPGALRPIAGLTPAAELDAVRDRPRSPQARAAGGGPDGLAEAAATLTLLDAGPASQLAAKLLPGLQAMLAAAPATTVDRESADHPWPSPEDLAERILTGRPSRSASDASGRLAPLELGFYASPAGGESAAAAGAASAAALDGSAGAAAGPLTLVAGSACAVSLVAGDGQFGAMGTVSLVDGDRVVLMAHPFLQLGPVDLPLAAASVVTLFPSRELSFKLGSAGPAVGRITHDLRAGLAGVLGETAPTVPVAVTVQLPAGSRTYDFQVALQPELTPQLVFWCLYNALLAEGDDRSLQLVRYRLEVDLRGQDGRTLTPVTLAGATGGPGGVNALQSDWQTPLQMLMNNRHEPLTLTALRAHLHVQKPLRAAQIVALYAPARVEPGERFTVEVELAERHGPRWRERFELRAPDSLLPGFLRLGAASAREFFSLDALRASGLFEDHSLAATIELLNRPRSPDDLTVALIAAEPGFTAGGRELAGLPPSVRHTLASGPPGSVRPTMAGYLLRASRSLPVLLQGDAVRDIEVRLAPNPRAEGVRP